MTTQPMTRTSILTLFLIILCAAVLGSPVRAQGIGDGAPGRVLFREIGKSDAEIASKVDSVYAAYFGGASNIYFEMGADEAYMLDTGNNDVRTEGIGYGMFITLQMNDKTKFDKLWTFAHRRMLRTSGDNKGYFCWHTDPNGKCLSDGPAPDGEVFMSAALYMAASRWGNGEGIYNYQSQADAITEAMLRTTGRSGGVTPMIDPATNIIVFVPRGQAATFTDPSYHTPHLFELFARRATNNKDRWKAIAATSRAFLATVPFKARDAQGNPTCLTADYSLFDGTPYGPTFNSNAQYYFVDAFRTVFHAAMDYKWWRGDASQPRFANCLLDFFTRKMDANRNHHARWQIDGIPVGNDMRTLAQTGMHGGAATIVPSTSENSKSYATDLWNAQPATGRYRYYDGLLHMFGLLAASDRYRVW